MLAFNTAILRRLSGIEVINALTYPIAADAQTQLAARLGTDARIEGGKAIYFGTFQPQAVTPSISFGNAGGVVDQRFGKGGGYVENPAVRDVTIFDKDSGGLLVEEIAEYVERLLNFRRCDDEGKPIAPALTLSAGYCYHGSIYVPLQTVYDEQGNQHIGLIRYAFIIRR